MSPPPSLVLLLDEMFSPSVCQVLRERGHSVLGVVERLDLRSAPDKDVYAWAASTGCWIMTENVKDFRPIAAHASQSGLVAVGLLYTSSRTFPRSRANITPLVDAVDKWLRNGPPAPPVFEAWLTS